MQKQRNQFQEALDITRAGWVSDSLIREYNLHHTIEMIVCAETLIEEERKEGMLRTIAELKLVYRENKPYLMPTACSAIEEVLACAENDVRNNEHWAAVIDVHGIERYFLQEYLPKLPNTDRDSRVNLILARKIAQSLGGEICHKENQYEEEDPADWWKK